jgi:hypothetical protein
LVRRIAGGLLAFFVLTATLLVLPVYAAPLPEAKPVAPSIDSVDLGSVDQPEDEAVVTTDGEVVDAGPDADVPPPDDAAPTPTPVDPAADDDAVASSGDEITGVPALTVSQPDTKHFSSVGVTWAQDEAVTGVSTQIRTKNASGVWSDWTAIQQDDVQLTSSTDPQDFRGGTAPYWTDDAYGIEVIVQAADGSTPRDVQVQLIDPGASAADANPGAPQAKDQAHAATTMPAIFSRAQWGADESLMGWDHEYAPTIKAATIHHTADSNNYTADDVPKIMRSIYAYHAVSLGWGDIGYNVVVDKFGRAWEGRSGGLSSTVIGAHAGGFNYGTFGISMLGNYDLVDTTPAMIETVASVVAWKLSLYGVNPRGRVTLTSAGGGTARYAAGVSVDLPTIFAHRDVGATACPGRYGYSHMDQIRALVATKMDAAGAQAAAEGGGARTLLRNSKGNGIAEWQINRGDPGDVPLACDWDGSGNDTVAVFRNGRFFLFNSNDSAAAPVADFWFGDRGDTPICGDWNGDGRDTIGIWRKGWFYLRNSNASGVAEETFAYGNGDAQPAVGDWNGDGRDTVAVYQNATFYYADTNVRPVAAGSVRFGDAGDRVVTGDWTGSGRDSFGVFRAGTFYFATSLVRSTADLIVQFGDRSDRPLVADWDGNRTTTVGIIRGY